MGSDDLYKKRKNERARLQAQRQQNLHVLILTEGISEQNYFLCIVNAFKLRTVGVLKSKHTNSSSIINEAINLAKKASSNGNEFDYIFCVFDLDTCNNKDYIYTIKNWNSKKNSTKIFPIYSYPCIEVWFILHFEVITHPFAKQGNKSIGDVTKDYFINKYVSEYSETDEDSIKNIANFYEKAVDNSKILIKLQKECNTINPITTVYKLLNFLSSMGNLSNNCQFRDDTEVFIEACLSDL